MLDDLNESVHDFMYKKECEHCGEIVSATTIFCPECRRRVHVQNPLRYIPGLPVLGVAALPMIFLGMLFENNSTSLIVGALLGIPIFYYLQKKFIFISAIIGFAALIIFIAVLVNSHSNNNDEVNDRTVLHSEVTNESNENQNNDVSNSIEEHSDVSDQIVGTIDDRSYDSLALSTIDEPDNVSEQNTPDDASSQNVNQSNDNSESENSGTPTKQIGSYQSEREKQAAMLKALQDAFKKPEISDKN